MARQRKPRLAKKGSREFRKASAKWRHPSARAQRQAMLARQLARHVEGRRAYEAKEKAYAKAKIIALGPGTKANARKAAKRYGRTATAVRKSKTVVGEFQKGFKRGTTRPRRTAMATRIGIGGGGALALGAGAGVAAWGARKQFKKRTSKKAVKKSIRQRHPTTVGQQVHRGTVSRPVGKYHKVDVSYTVTKEPRVYRYRHGRNEFRNVKPGKKGGPHHSTRQRRDRYGRFA